MTLYVKFRPDGEHVDDRLFDLAAVLEREEADGPTGRAVYRLESCLLMAEGVTLKAATAASAAFGVSHEWDQT